MAFRLVCATSRSTVARTTDLGVLQLLLHAQHLVVGRAADREAGLLRLEVLVGEADGGLGQLEPLERGAMFEARRCTWKRISRSVVAGVQRRQLAAARAACIWPPATRFCTGSSKRRPDQVRSSKPSGLAQRVLESAPGSGRLTPTWPTKSSRGHRVERAVAMSMSEQLEA